jgi:hypothetical protein
MNCDWGAEERFLDARWSRDVLDFAFAFGGLHEAKGKKISKSSKGQSLVRM